MKRTKLFLIASSVAAVAVCICIFVWMLMFMGRKSEESIRDIGTIYMSEMNKHVQQKFFTLINFRLSQLEGVLQRTPPSSVQYGPHMLNELRLNAEVRDFSYLGLYAQDGEVETLYGSAVTLANTEDFWALLEQDGKVIGYGTDRQGRRLLVLGIPASYPMKGGVFSAAVVAGVEMQEIAESLFVNDTQALVFSHIIDHQGRFVVRRMENGRKNYFQFIHDAFASVGQKTALHFARDIQQAMDEKVDFSSLVQVGGEFHHLYLSALPNTDWFLVSELPQGVLDQAIFRLSDARFSAILLVALVVTLLLVVIFTYYYFISQAQMKRLSSARKEADRASKAKSEFLSNMSHDIRTPMNAVVGMTDIALADITDSARVEDCLKKIKLSSKHLLGLINDILDMSKIESGKLTLTLGQVSLRDTVSDLISIMQPEIKAKKQKFDVFIRQIQAENILCDSVRLNQIVLNLLSNAVKFTPPEGEICVYLSQEDSARGADFVRTHLRVKDTGIGMSAEFKDKIFESFAREDNARVYKIMGTGLGMAITKYLVELMGGTITVESTQGQGTEFHIVLDFKKVPQDQQEMRLPPWHMLVVDDNVEVLQSAAVILEELGVRADTAPDGKTAVQMVEDLRLAGENYDAVLLDWKMPGMDGLETVREMRRRMGTLPPVCLFSAYDWSSVEAQARAEGVCGFIAKPLFKSTLFFGLNQFAVCSLNDEPKSDPNLAPKVNLAGKRVLLAEDNELNREVAHDILTEEGLLVEWAENGRTCVEKFQASAPGYYDAVLMDLRMPEMTGYEAARAIRALDRPDRDIPIIAMTADAFAEDIQRCLDSGMNAHTTKPINTVELFRLLAKHLG